MVEVIKAVVCVSVVVDVILSYTEKWSQIEFAKFLITKTDSIN